MPPPALSPPRVFSPPPDRSRYSLERSYGYVDPSGDHLKDGIQIGNQRIVKDTYLRITGTLVLDCGHGIGTPCFDDPSVPWQQNQEIHPIYSIDIINFPFRPEDGATPARQKLTGAWGGSDGSTYYVRQIGNTIWWLGQPRDRQPIPKGND